jgi:hypothetical protein
MFQTGGLMVNEYEAAASYPVMVFLNIDWNEYPPKRRGMFIERAIEAAAAVCLKASRERQELGIILYTSYQEGGISVVIPAAFTLVPILERLAALDWTKTPDDVAPPDGGAVNPFLSANDRRSYASKVPGGNAHNSAGIIFEQGKRLAYGTRFLYIGPDLGDEAYISLNSLKRDHLYLEYLIIDERAMPSLVPGNSPRYQMKEQGYEII